MAKELKQIGTSGSTVYEVVINAAAQFWNTSGTPAFETETDGHWANYAVAMTEQGTSGFFAGNFPTGIATAGEYNVEFRQQAGGSAALSDPVIGSGTIKWAGSAEGFNLASSAASAANVAMNGTNIDANVIQIAGQTASAAGAVTFPGSIGTSTFSGGAVASVTGNVGGNVIGSVGSVAAAVTLPTGTGAGQINLSGGAVTLQANQAVNATAIGGVSTGTAMLSGVGVYSSGSLVNTPSTGATAGQVATAVWKDLISGGDFTTNGSIGNLLAGYTTPPSASSIAAAIQSLGAISFTIVSPLMQNGALTIVAGDDYFNADGRAVTFTFSAGSQPNLTGATITLKGNKSAGIYNAGSNNYSTSGVVSAGGSGQQTVYVELPESLTSGLAIGAMAYDFSLVAALATSGHEVTLAQGTLTVKAQE